MRSIKMTHHIIGSPPGYFVLIPTGHADGAAEILPVIAWIVFANAPPQPITINGPAETASYGLECPDGMVLDKELPASANREEWLQTRRLAELRAGCDPAHFHLREPVDGHHDA